MSSNPVSLAEVVKFLLGEGPLEGVHFGDPIQLQFHEKYGNAMANANAAYQAEQSVPSGVQGERNG